MSADTPEHRADGEPDSKLSRHERDKLIDEMMRRSSAAHLALPDTEPIDMLVEVEKPTFESHPTIKGSRHSAGTPNYKGRSRKH